MVTNNTTALGGQSRVLYMQFVLLTFTEMVTIAHYAFIFALHRKEYHIGWTFRYMKQHL